MPTSDTKKVIGSKRLQRRNCANSSNKWNKIIQQKIQNKSDLGQAMTYSLVSFIIRWLETVCAMFKQAKSFSLLGEMEKHLKNCMFNSLFLIKMMLM